MSDSHSSSSSVDLEAAIERVQSWPEQIASLEAEVERLRKRTHELQEKADAAEGPALRELNRWKQALALADQYLKEPGIAFQSAIVRAKVADLLAQLAAQTAVVEQLTSGLERVRDMAVRPACVCGRPTGTSAIWSAANTALKARLDAADVPAASTGENEQ